MATSKRKAGPRTTTRSTGVRRSGRRTRKNAAGSESPDVYDQMLSEVQNPAQTDGEDRPLKRRKTAKTSRHAESSEVTQPLGGYAATATSDIESLFHESEPDDDDFEDVHISHLQTISASESEEDEDAADQNVSGQQEDTTLQADDSEIADGSGGDLSIVLGATSTPEKKVGQGRRKALTALEKKIVTIAHKLHVACLMVHVHIRNAWCNDVELRNHMKRTLPAKTIKLLNPDRNSFQAQRTSNFIDGLKAAVDAWKSRFAITLHGLRHPHGLHPEKFKLTDMDETLLNRSDFRQAAKELQGSADTGAQLFCALLRAVGVEARLVCSLQVIALSGSALGTNPQADRTQKPTIYADTSDQHNGVEDSNAMPQADAQESDTSASAPKRVSRLGGSRTTLSGPSHIASHTPSVGLNRRLVARPTHPVFWAEAFNEAAQKWIAVDPIATGTVGKISAFEPPLRSSGNHMSYVIAFEDDGVAKDVTKRYARSYNAKTRKRRIESTEGGEVWFNKAMRLFRNRIALDRDQLEQAELARREASEAMPRNVEDFKGHPQYALERHLRHNEIIQPKRIVGKVQVGKTSDRAEPVYRRQDVQVARSADKWYRLGQEVKTGQQPVKHAKPRKGRARSADDEEMGADGEPLGVGLYTESQTKIYVPPPVIRGRIPKNAFGNLDICVASMVPDGGVHLRSPETAKAARLIGVDYADAVTGFKFKGRQGTAVIEGAIVAAEHAEAVKAVIDTFSHAREEAEASRRSRAALRMWRRFFTGLRILQHVDQYRGDDEPSDIEAEIDRAEAEEDMALEAGGFLPGADDGPLAMAYAAGPDLVPDPHHQTIARFDSMGLNTSQSLPHVNMKSTQEFSEATPVTSYNMTNTSAVSDDQDFGGGFVPEESESAGGFLPEATAEEEPLEGGFMPVDDPGNDIMDSEPRLEEPELGSSVAFNAYNPQMSDEAPQHARSASSPAADERHDDVDRLTGGATVYDDGGNQHLESQHQLSCAEPMEEEDAVTRPTLTDIGPSLHHLEADAVRSQAHQDGADTPTATQPPNETAIETPAPSSPRTDATSSDEQRSLLSHDPDDDDAEPDWGLG